MRFLYALYSLLAYLGPPALAIFLCLLLVRAVKNAPLSR